MMSAPNIVRASTPFRPSSAERTFYFAEDYHQQYLAKNPLGYCGLGGTGVSCPIGTGVRAAG
jgi:peptide methionine sulfoxide reductase MsrA